MNVPSLKTSPATEITAATATAGGEVITEGGIKATARGLVWSTTNNPTVALTTKTLDGAGTGVFVSKRTVSGTDGVRRISLEIINGTW